MQKQKQQNHQQQISVNFQKKSVEKQEIHIKKYAFGYTKVHDVIDDKRSENIDIACVEKSIWRSTNVKIVKKQS